MTQDAPDPAKSLREKAAASHQRGDLTAAEPLYLQALSVAPGDSGLCHGLAILRAQQGRIPEALDLIGTALKSSPADAGLLLDQGNLLNALGRAQDALRSYDKALTIRPDYADALSNRGIVLRQLGRLDESLKSFDEALAVRPDFIPALNDRGITLCQMGHFDQALASFDRALSLNPSDLGALNNRGFALKLLKRLGEALASYDRALAIAPNFADAQNNRSIILRELNRLDLALESNSRALAIRPDDAESLINRGIILLDMDRPDEALISLDKALIIRPDSAEASFNRGNCLRRLGRLQDALASFDRCLAARSHDAAAWNNRGIVLAELSRPEEALASYDQALAIEPGSALALYSRGVALWELKHFEAARNCYELAWAARPEHPLALGAWAHAALHMCDWSGVAQVAPILMESVAAGRSGIMPFVFLGYSDSPAAQLQCARNFAAAGNLIRPKPLWNGTAYRHDRIRIAYMSSDFRRHPMTSCIAELFELHDRSLFEVVAVSHGENDHSEMRARIAGAVDRFVDVRGTTDKAAAALVREMETDILVDLNGYTQNARSIILHHRPAPAQVSYMGYPGTMGTDIVDYIIADRQVLPPGDQQYFTEKVLYLPHSYWVNDSKRAIGGSPTRAQAGLPEQGFVFCCFNNNWKITAPIFDIWMRLLKAIPGSVLWLLETNPVARGNLCREAAERGVDPARLIFASLVSPSEHLGRFALADLLLDTLPYNMHTTACDALWTGVPLITCPGKSFASRVASSLLIADGVPELVAATLEEYEDLALKLAADPESLNSIRRRLQKHRASQRLFDTNGFCRDIEILYSNIVAQTQPGAAGSGMRP